LHYFQENKHARQWSLEAEVVLSQFTLSDSAMDNSLQELQLRDYLDILRRRKLWILLTALGVFVMGVVVAVRLPNVYHAKTVIVVDPQQVPDSIVPTMVSSSVLDRLSTIRQLVLSPTRLAALIQKHNLFPAQKGPRDGEQLVTAMQKAITIEVADAGNQRLSAFEIGYTSRNPKEAADVANELASMVIQESLKAREHQFSGAEEFLETELQATKKQLEQKEDEVSRIKTQYIGDLPESKQFHLEALENLRSQLRTSQDRVSRDQQEKVYFQSMLVTSNPVIDIDANGSEAVSSPTQGQIEKLETSLVELRARYGADYPDVRKLQSQLDALRAKKAQEEENAPKRDVSVQAVAHAAKNPVVTSQIAKLDQEISEQTKLQSQLNDQINFHVSKLERVPVFESRIAGLMRDYDSLRVHYNQLLERKLSAGMASNLESHQKAERFETLDVAKVPEKPAAPNRPLIGLGALLGGLFVGLGVGLMVDLSDTAVRSEKEAARILGAPVLAGIPVIVSRRQLIMDKMRVVFAAAATVVCSAGAGFLITLVSG
jgi:polysaccharide chain length determinant protein (PEP-CTERM system associated)